MNKSLSKPAPSKRSTGAREPVREKREQAAFVAAVPSCSTLALRCRAPGVPDLAANEALIVSRHRADARRLLRRYRALRNCGRRGLLFREAATIASAARAHRLAVQDVALSRRKHGFESRRARQRSRTLILPSRCLIGPQHDANLPGDGGRLRGPGLAPRCHACSPVSPWQGLQLPLRSIKSLQGLS